MKISIKFQRIIFYFLILIVGFTAWSILKTIEHTTRLEIGQSLQVVLDTTRQGIKTWARENKAAVRVWGNDPVVVLAAKSLLPKASDRETLLNDQGQINLRHWFQSLQQVTGYQGYFIVDKNNVNLASSRDQNVGLSSLLAERPEFLQKIWSGEAVVSHPYISDVPLPDEKGNLKIGLPTMFVGAPIYDDSHNVIAVFTFRLNPASDFNHIFQHGRLGKTGETYAFDRNAILMSNSRFEDQLQKMGLLEAGERAMLNIELREPEDKTSGDANTNQQRPLTLMARQAIAQTSGIELSGYSDYRGVNVIGAWSWDKDLDYGFATEQNIEEAFKALTFTRVTILVMSVLLMLLLLLLAEITTLQRKRKLAEQSAQALLEAGPDAIVVVNQSGEITFINDQTTQILGYTQADIVGSKVDVLLPYSTRTDHQRHREVFNSKPYRREMGQGMDLVARHKSGKNIPVEISLSPFETEQGILIASAIRDVSKRKEAENKLKEYRDQLEDLVSKRTADLVASNKELESYSYSIAHDLRTPLRSIISFSQLLKDQIGEGATSDNIDMLNRISNAGIKLAQLIDDILQLSRFTRQSMKFEEFNLSDVANTCIEEIKQLKPERNIKCTIAKNMIIKADRGLMTLVLKNLLENAWKYTSDKAVSEIELGQKVEDNENVYFVKDNGIGFNMDFENKLFKPFHRLHPDMDVEGAGVGLAIVERIVHRHGGKIWGESRENQGSTFYFSIPQL